MDQVSRWFRPVKNVLLTGAGFTRDFGGYLASEMWAAILRRPEIREHPKLRKCMLEELEYEAFYYRVLSSESFTDKEKALLTKAVHDAYHEMDALIYQGDRKCYNGHRET